MKIAGGILATIVGVALLIAGCGLLDKCIMFDTPLGEDAIRWCEWQVQKHPQLRPSLIKKLEKGYLNETDYLAFVNESDHAAAKDSLKGLKQDESNHSR